jgi:hypothetical protein
MEWKRRVAPYVVIVVGLMPGYESLPAAAGKMARFGFKCARPEAVLPPGVKKVVTGLVANAGDARVVTYGDRAVTLRLRRGSEITYFVPLSCDGSGNCKWAIVAPSPARSLGVVGGRVFMVKTGGSEWPEVQAFSVTRADQSEMPKGSTETLEFKGDGYHRKSLAAVDPGLVGTLSSCLEDKSCCPPAT